MPNTQVSLCNLALDKISEKPITTIADVTPRAEACAREYQPALDQVLEEGFWNFAQKRAALTINSTAPAFGYSSAFDLPDDFVNVDVFNNASVKDYDVQRLFKIEGNQFLTDETVANIVYTRNGTVFTSPDTIDTFAALMTPMFVSVFTRLLAAAIAPTVKNDGGQIAGAQMQIYVVELSKALTKNANARKRQPIQQGRESRVLAARRYSTLG